MFKSGCGKWGYGFFCALFLCLVISGCVQRQPRINSETNEPSAKSEESSDRCGLICRLKRKASENKGKSRFERDYAKYKAEKDKGSGASKSGASKPSASKSSPSKPSWRDKLKGGFRKSRIKPGEGKGVYHTVKKGETFWRICKAYGVNQDKVARINGLDDPSSLSVGQRIWIPGAERVMDIPGPRKSIYLHKSDNSRPPADSKAPRPEKISPSDPMRGSLLFPVPGGKLTSHFGMRGNRMHEGVDIVAKKGSDVLAADDGKVVYADDKIRGYGKMIIIKHAGNISTVYAHNSKNLVKAGDFVKRGEKIAEVGQTGRATTAHLHFEVRIGEKAVNPEYYLP